MERSTSKRKDARSSRGKRREKTRRKYKESRSGRNGNDVRLKQGPRTFSKGRDGDSLVEGRRAKQFPLTFPK